MAKRDMVTASPTQIPVPKTSMTTRININAAERLGEGGFASETRVASARAAQEAALAGVQAAEAGVAAAEKEIERLSIRAPFAGLRASMVSI